MIIVQIIQYLFLTTLTVYCIVWSPNVCVPWEDRWHCELSGLLGLAGHGVAIAVSSVFLFIKQRIKLYLG